MFLPAFFNIIPNIIAPAFFVYWGWREGKRPPNERNISLALLLLAAVSAVCWMISYATQSQLTRNLNPNDIYFDALMLPAFYALLFFAARRIFDAHRETMANWIEAVESDQGQHIHIRQAVGRRATRFFSLLGLTIASLGAIVFGAAGDVSILTLIGVLGFLVCGFATLLGLFPYLASLGARKIITLEVTDRALQLSNPVETIPFASVTEVTVHSANDASFAVQPKKTDRNIFVGGTGAAGASFAAASVVASGAKTVGDVAGQSAVLGLHLVRSGSDCSVEIAHGGGRRKVAAYLNKEEAHALAQQIANVTQAR